MQGSVLFRVPGIGLRIPGFAFRVPGFAPRIPGFVFQASRPDLELKGGGVACSARRPRVLA